MVPERADRRIREPRIRGPRGLARSLPPESALDPLIDHAFSPDGPLASSVAGWRTRPGQVEMAQAVATALAGRGVLVAEAGTGTGKTFAYLVPALLAGGKVIVSTGTRTLQDQLFGRDLPLVRDALRLPVGVALLKGRSNYVCRHHLERNLEEASLASARDAADLREIARFAKRSSSGDRGELSTVSEQSPAWALATSTRDSCLGGECPQFQDCFVMRARREALAADVVVVNHHLFFADVVLRDTGYAELLPACDAVIFDEAHALPETASLFFGETVSTHQLIDLARDTRAEALAGARDDPALPKAASVLDRAARDLRLALQDDSGRLTLGQLRGRRAFLSALDAVLVELDALGRQLAQHAERSEGLGRCVERTESLHRALARWRSRALAPVTPFGAAAAAGAVPAPDAGADRTDDDGAGAGPDEGGWVLWGEVMSHAVALHATPLSVARVFREQLAAGGHPRAWVFTSATLAIDGDFRHFVDAMGLEGATCASWPSPYDYASRSLLYLPPDMPEPAAPDYARALVQAALPLIEAAGGRTFVLCTSLRAMRAIHALLDEALRRRGLIVPLMLQGEASRSELLARFRESGNAVLVASHSFWEGVDVRGEALSVVVIDKLPFAPPDDPVLAARIEQATRSGTSAFATIQLPEAAITLKQGAGRLIRDEADRGVLMIGDPRLLGRSYGRRLIRSLPPMRLTRDIGEACAFLRAPRAG